MATRIDALRTEQSASIASLVSGLAAANVRIDEQEAIITAQGFTTTSPTSSPTTPAPTSITAAPTAPPHPAPTAAPTREDIAVGNIIMTALRDPPNLCSGGSLTRPTGCRVLDAADEAAVVELTGDLRIDYTDLITIAARFPNMVSINGRVIISNNDNLTTFEGGFPMLAVVRGDFEMRNNRNNGVPLHRAFPSLRTVGGNFKYNANQEGNGYSAITDSFPVLETIGGNFEIMYDSQNGDSGRPQSSNNLRAIGGTSFQSLRTVAGRFRVHSMNGLNTISGSSFESLATVRELYISVPLSTVGSAVFSSLREVGEGGLSLSWMSGPLSRFPTGVFSALEVVRGDFTVFQCSALLGLETFTSLTNITRTLKIALNNPEFEADLALPSLACVGDLFDAIVPRHLQLPSRAATLPQCV